MPEFNSRAVLRRRQQLDKKWTELRTQQRNRKDWLLAAVELKNYRQSPHQSNAGAQTRVSCRGIFVTILCSLEEKRSRRRFKQRNNIQWLSWALTLTAGRVMRWLLRAVVGCQHYYTVFTSRQSVCHILRLSQASVIAGRGDGEEDIHVEWVYELFNNWEVLVCCSYCHPIAWEYISNRYPVQPSSLGKGIDWITWNRDWLDKRWLVYCSLNVPSECGTDCGLPTWRDINFFIIWSVGYEWPGSYTLTEKLLNLPIMTSRGTILWQSETLITILSTNVVMPKRYIAEWLWRKQMPVLGCLPRIARNWIWN